MKILVLQLARLGDIYQSWPVLRAMKRAEPDTEVHLLTRAKFASAIEGLEAVDRHWPLDSRSILTPLIDEKPDFTASLELLGSLCDALREEGYDRIVNLSFSPLSSFLVSDVASPWTEIRGYSRTSDGFLSIPDDASAYFYAQVGQGRANRAHVTDLFAAVAGVDLAPEDFRAPAMLDAAKSALSLSLKNPIVIHAGASDLRKTLGWSKWLQVVKGLLAQHDGDVVLIGSKEERDISERIAGVTGPRQVVNMTGQTSLTQLFALIGIARLVIGGDSAPVHIAALTGTPVLNLSFPIVSHWETGPKSAGSRVVRVESEESFTSDEIVREAMAVLRGEDSAIAISVIKGPLEPVDSRADELSFEWELLKGLYMDGAFPEPRSTLFVDGIRRLSEVNDLALEQIASLRHRPDNATASAILDRADEIIAQIARVVPETAPIVRWFQTERLRIGPMAFEQLIEVTAAVHNRLGEVLKIYTETPAGREGARGHDDVVLG